ncbi:Tctex-1 [Pelagophyceae sp. CCMP2097]|nr:Tctex-1 [Pelagophyceae sp. CCMP2097]
MDDEMFPGEDVEIVMKTAISQTLGDAPFISKKVVDWTRTIIDSCIKEFQALGRPYKYVVTVLIMQKTGSPSDTGAAMFWDAGKDGVVSTLWENTTMYVNVTTYGVALNVDTADLE